MSSETIQITSEIRTAYNVYLDESVDHDILRRPIQRRHTPPFTKNEGCGLADFAAGYQAALDRREPASKPSEEREVLAQLVASASANPHTSEDHARLTAAWERARSILASTGDAAKEGEPT